MTPILDRNIIEPSEKLATDLRSGRILGSTEAAYKVLDMIDFISREYPEILNKYLVEWIPAFMEARPTSLVMINLTRQFLEEYVALLRSLGSEESAYRVRTIISKIKQNIEEVKEVVATLGSRRISDDDTILTHSYSTTVIKLLGKALERGIKFNVIVTESRPISEGFHTAEILNKMGIRTTLIVDSAIRYVMKKVSKVIVGADAVAANGAVINKVGTSAIALAAKEARVRTYVAAGTYKFGYETVFGELIEGVVLNEPRLMIPEKELSSLTGKVIIKEPLFDVTPPEYIDAIITEYGLIAPQAIPIIVRELHGWPPKLRSIDELLKEVSMYV